MLKIKKLFLISLLLPIILLSQDSKCKEKDLPFRAIKSRHFEVKNLCFNKIFEPHGKGYILQVEFELVNLTDITLDFYIFTIATFEELAPPPTSFNRPGEERMEVRNFNPYPYDLKNFEVASNDNKDNQKQGKVYIKFPRDVKAGINPATGKPYQLKTNLIVGTHHLSEFRKNYEFFNVVTILLFDVSELQDKEGNLTPAFRQIYQIKGIRK